MTKKTFLIGLMSIAATIFSPSGVEAKSRDKGIIDEVQSSTETVVKQVLKRHELSGDPVLVMSAQAIDNFQQSEATGRMLGDLVSSSLTQLGMPVKEIRMSKGVTVTSEGEQFLTREYEKLLKTEHNSEIIFVTTFTKQTFNKVLITIRAVRLSDGVVLGSNSFVSDLSLE